MLLLWILLWLAGPVAAEDFCGPHPCPIRPRQLCRCDHHVQCQTTHALPVKVRQAVLCPLPYRLPLPGQATVFSDSFAAPIKPHDPGTAPEPRPPRPGPFQENPK